MEKLAQELVNTNSVSMVSKIYDQYLDVIALEPALFTLNIKDSFMLYNEPSLTEVQIRYECVLCVFGPKVRTKVFFEGSLPLSSLSFLISRSRSLHTFYLFTEAS